MSRVHTENNKQVSFANKSLQQLQRQLKAPQVKQSIKQNELNHITVCLSDITSTDFACSSLTQQPNQ